MNARAYPSTASKAHEENDSHPEQRDAKDLPMEYGIITPHDEVCAVAQEIRYLLDNPEEISIESLESCSEPGQKIHDILLSATKRTDQGFSLKNKSVAADYVYLLQMYNFWQALLELRNTFGNRYYSELFCYDETAIRHLKENGALTSAMIAIQREFLIQNKYIDHNRKRMTIHLTNIPHRLRQIFSFTPRTERVDIEGLMLHGGPSICTIATLHTEEANRISGKVQHTSQNISYPLGAERALRTFLANLMKERLKQK